MFMVKNTKNMSVDELIAESNRVMAELNADDERTNTLLKELEENTALISDLAKDLSQKPKRNIFSFGRK